MAWHDKRSLVGQSVWDYAQVRCLLWCGDTLLVFAYEDGKTFQVA